MPLTTLLVLTALLLIVVGVVFHQVFWPDIRHRHIVKQPFPSTWEPLLRRALPLFAALSEHEQAKLKNLIKQFVADKRFVGCAGQEINDEIRVTIAANACLLLLNRTTQCYPQLQTILVYPSTFVTSREQRDSLGLVSTHTQVVVGESWSDGKIILAWDDVLRGVSNFHDGRNVVLHEFAHELDHEDGASNGAPVLRTRGAYKQWAAVFAQEFSALNMQAVNGLPSVMDKYGATNPAEFFAVATETFFERPADMKAHHRELYNELADYYQIDPATWLSRSASA